MQTLIEICIDRINGALLRALGVIERRGFEIESINALTSTERHQHYVIGLNGSGRDVDVLVRQLKRNVDLAAARVLAAGAVEKAVPTPVAVRCEVQT